MRCLSLSALLAAATLVEAQTVAPREVTVSAIAAVEALGKRVVLGDHKAAIDSMYPQWKKRMAKRFDGIEKLEEQLEGIGEEMARNGVAIISFKAQGAPSVYEVWPGKMPEDAGPDAKPVFDKWLLLIPTVTQFRILQGDPPEPYVINSFGFQVAIADKGRDNWTFINGSDVSVSDLRSLFASLPANMELPPVKREVAE